MWWCPSGWVWHPVLHVLQNIAPGIGLPLDLKPIQMRLSSHCRAFEVEHAIFAPSDTIVNAAYSDGMLRTPGGHWPAAGLTSTALPARTSATSVKRSKPFCTTSGAPSRRSGMVNLLTLHSNS